MSVAPVHRLPAELLLNILDIILLPWPSHPPTDGRRDWQTRSPNWKANTRFLVTATHVCERWRAIALNAPALWNHVDDGDPARIRAFLSRSALLPLFAVLGAPSRIGLFSGALAQRLRRLDIDLTTVSSLPQYAKLTMPLLEVLTLVLPDSHYQALTYDAPALKALAVYGSCGYWPLTSSAFSKLTHLHICAHGLPPTYLVDFFHFLSRSSNLEVLHISDFKFLDPRFVVPNGRTSLPYLRTLWMNVTLVSDATSFLSCLVLPRSCRVLVEAYDLGHHEALQDIPSRQLSLSVHDHRMNVSLQTESGARIQIKSGLSPQEEPGWLRVPLLHPSTRTLRVSLDSWHLLLAIIEGLPQLTTLALVSTPPPGQDGSTGDGGQITNDSVILVLAECPLPLTLEAVSIQGARMFDRSPMQYVWIQSIHPTASIILDPVWEDHPALPQWRAAYRDLPRVTVAAGAGLCRWDGEVSVDADRELQTRYWPLDPDEGHAAVFPWDE